MKPDMKLFDIMNKTITAIASTAIILLAGCTQSLENTYSNQESKIDSFLAGTQKKIYDSAPKEGEEGYEDFNALVADGLGQIAHNGNSNRLILYPNRQDTFIFRKSDRALRPVHVQRQCQRKQSGSHQP